MAGSYGDLCCERCHRTGIVSKALLLDSLAMAPPRVSFSKTSQSCSRCAAILMPASPPPKIPILTRVPNAPFLYFGSYGPFCRPAGGFIAPWSRPAPRGQGPYSRPWPLSSGPIPTSNPVYYIPERLEVGRRPPGPAWRTRTAPTTSGCFRRTSRPKHRGIGSR